MSDDRTMDRIGSGVEREGARAWLGIRYARAGRFQPPVLEALDPAGRYDTAGAAPYQVPPEMPDLGAAPDEDCHFLNVWAPPGPVDEPLPVYVSVYGGGFEQGAGSAWPQDGARLAAAGGVVVVSPNYRVGALGFLALSQHGGPFDHATNLGLRDLVVALRWVRENIARFGGDPDRVTVVGESAGGFLAAALPAVPSADGLYAQLSVHSAAASRIVPAGRAVEMADGLLDAFGLRDRPHALLQVAAADLVRAQGQVVSTDIGVRNGPAPQAFGVVDDSALPNGILAEHPASAFAAGRARQVGLLVSATQDEISGFRAASPAQFDPGTVGDVVAEVTGWGLAAAQAERIVQHHVDRLGSDATPGSVRERVLSDYVYRLPAARLAQLQADAGGRAHLVLIGGVDGQPAPHSCAAAGLVGRHMPVSSPAADRRDDELRDIVRSFVTGAPLPWPACPAGAVLAHGIGELRQSATESFAQTLAVWSGVPRP